MYLSRKLTVLPVLACALALGAAACGGGGDDEKTSADVPADAIALVGDQPVPKAEFTSLIDRAEDSYKAQKQAFPKVGSPEYQDLKTRAVQFLVQRYEYREEADSLGLSVTDDEITKRLDQIKKQSYGGSEEKFQADLKKLGLTEEEAREEIEDRIIQEKIYKKVTGNLSVSDEEITQFYETNQAQFTQPRKVRHILVKQKALADKLYTQLKNGASFAALAKKYSQDTGSAKKGGELTIQKGQTVAPFDKVAFELDKGEISKPVKTQFGWHIIQALAPVKTTPLDDVKNTIKQQLLTQKQKSAMDTWLKELQRKYSSSVVYAVGYQPTQQASSQ